PLSPSHTSDSELSEISQTDLSALERAVSKHRSYPSPSSSNRSSAKPSPVPENMAFPPSSNDDDERPRKKRKMADAKERTTARLDLRNDLTETDKPQLDRLLKTLHKKRKIVVIAGAGISVAAGIPDFRSSTGLFKTLRNDHKRISSGKDLFDASVYQDDSSTSSFHDMVRNLSQQTKNAQPTEFHHLLATLAKEGRLLRLYTQNVDGIDSSLEPLRTTVPLPKKGPWPKTVQLHGGLDHMVCSKCHALSDFDAEKFNGPIPPACPTCVENDSVRQVAEKRSHGIGRLRPRMVLYNEHNPDDEAIGSCVSADLRTRPDAVIVAGTTLKVPGVRRITREMCLTVKDRKDGVNIWINNDPEPMGKDLADVWDLVVQGPCEEVARHACMLHHDAEITRVVSDDQVPKQQPTVVIPGSQTPKKGTVKVQGQLTPARSPLPFAHASIKPEPTAEPGTPSKRGTKRKSQGVKSCAFEKMDCKPPSKRDTKRSQAQPKKTANSKRNSNKEMKSKTPLMTDMLKAKKNSTTKQNSAMKIIPSKYNTTIPSQLSVPGNDTMHSTHPSIPVTPTRNHTKGAKVTKYKLDTTLIQIPASDPRNNQSPKRPDMEAFTPAKRTASQQLQEEHAQSR
ncbi:DHS-like NAD/FAD-binding domain-containing protein, partial [Periconia macrospinosa]